MPVCNNYNMEAFRADTLLRELEETFGYRTTDANCFERYNNYLRIVFAF